LCINPMVRNTLPPSTQLPSNNETPTLVQDQEELAPTQPAGNVQQCGKCKEVTEVKLCFAPDCGKPRCLSCVQSICRKNQKKELQDDEGSSLPFAQFAQR